MFASNVYLGEGGVTGENRIKELIAAMPVCLEADAAASAAKKAKRAPTEAEATLIARADTLREKLVQVTLALALALTLTLTLALALAPAPIPTPTPTLTLTYRWTCMPGWALSRRAAPSRPGAATCAPRSPPPRRASPLTRSLTLTRTRTRTLSLTLALTRTRTRTRTLTPLAATQERLGAGLGSFEESLEQAQPLAAAAGA